MTCAKCKADIEQDSFYCDQCGTELLICPKCNIPKVGKVCTTDGAKLVAARELAVQPTMPVSPGAPPVPASPAAAMPQPAAAPQPAPPAAATPAPPAGGTIPALRLVNHAVHIDISPASGDIIGRKQGAFVPLFSSYSQISGKHAQVQYTPALGWTITDLDSANGSQYNGARLAPLQPQPLQHNSRIILANIEFIVEITGGAAADPDRTVRL